MYQAEIDEIEKIQASLQSLPATGPVATQPVSVSEGPHPSLANMTQAQRLEHIQEMLMQGYSNDQILALHPELELQDIIRAGAAAARNN